MAYTKEQQIGKLPAILGKELFLDKCDVFRNTLFPTPPKAPSPTWDTYRPNDWNWSHLTPTELELACLAKAKGKTPGPDAISQDIIKQAYKAILNIFYKLFSCLIDIGYYPKC